MSPAAACDRWVSALERQNSNGMRATSPGRSHNVDAARSFKIPGEEYAPPADETVTIKQLEEGAGPEAVSGSTVTMRYRLLLLAPVEMIAFSSDSLGACPPRPISPCPRAPRLLSLFTCLVTRDASLMGRSSIRRPRWSCAGLARDLPFRCSGSAHMFNKSLRWEFGGEGEGGKQGGGRTGGTETRRAGGPGERTDDRTDVRETGGRAEEEEGWRSDVRR